MKEGNKGSAKTFFDDSAITAKVKASFAADSIMKALRIHVTTKQGVVRLTGNVKGDGDRNKAEALAFSTEGVESVINDIKVEG